MAKYLDYTGLVEYSLKLKDYIDQQIQGTTSSYSLSLTDEGYVQCVKNGTDEGFAIDDNGMVYLN